MDVLCTGLFFKLALKVQRFQCKCISRSGIFCRMDILHTWWGHSLFDLTMSSDSLHFNWCLCSWSAAVKIAYQSE